MASKQAIVTIPYDRAQFYFAPEYLATAEVWQATFRRHTEEILLSNGCGGKIAHAHGYSIVVSWGTLELTINARLGTFAIWETDGKDEDERPSDCWPGHETVPDRFLDELYSAPLPERFAEGVFLHIVPFTIAILRRMTEALERALDEKRTEVRYFPAKGRENPISSGFDGRYEPVAPLSEKLFFVALPRSTSVTNLKDKAVRASEPDGRVKHDWKKIDRILEEEYARIRMKPHRTRTELKNAIDVRLANKSPNSGMIFQRIKTLFPNF